MSTPHNTAKPGEIAETVLLPGDPLRAKVIAETFLEDVVQFNTVRNMFGYTGTYKGKKVSVMGTGMGCPSIGIYSHELVHVYGAKNLIRVGSCGGMQPDIRLGDVIFALGSCTNSNWAHQYNLKGTFSAIASFDLLKKATKAAEEMGVSYHAGNVFASDVFYDKNASWKDWAAMGCLGVEMESYALYAIAAEAGVNALTILTVSDSMVSGEEMGPQERQNNFTTMMKIALETALEA